MDRERKQELHASSAHKCRSAGFATARRPPPTGHVAGLVAGSASCLYIYIYIKGNRSHGTCGGGQVVGQAGRGKGMLGRVLRGEASERRLEPLSMVVESP